MQQDNTQFRFSLAEMSKRECSEALRDIAGCGVDMNFVPLTKDPQTNVDICSLPGIAISRGLTSRNIAASGVNPMRGSDDFALVWGPAAENAVLRNRGDETVGDDGAAILISCADRGSAETPRVFPHLTVRLQRSLLDHLLPDAEAALMRPIPAHNEALALLTAYIGTLGKSAVAPGPELAHVISQHVADLVALAAKTSRDATHVAHGPGLRTARLVAIKRWTLARLGDPELNVNSAAAVSGVSARYVQQLFEAEGMTFRAFVLSYRLRLAHRRLANPGLVRRTISDIVFACGFGDLSYFDRSFRAAYGETPSDVRRRAQVHTISPDSSFPDNSCSLQSKTAHRPMHNKVAETRDSERAA